MRASIILPLPFDDWDTFKPFIQRFCDTFRKYPPEFDYQLIAVCNWGKSTDEERHMFRGIKTRFASYYDDGCDLGSWVKAAGVIPADGFQICCTSRVYFHRSGWLRRFMEEREKHGPGLYTTSASNEVRLHACLRCFGVDTEFLLRWPVPLPVRPETHNPDEPYWGGLAFETGLGSPMGSFSEWIEGQNKAVKLVTWDGCYDKNDWFTPKNRFRDGDQSNLLVFDRHSDAYRDADEAEKKRLADKTNPKSS